MAGGRIYTQEEIEFIKENYKTMTYPEIAKILGRDNRSVKYKVTELGLKKRCNNLEDKPDCLYGEIWKDVPNYEGYYKVSSMVRVRSVNRFDKAMRRNLKEKILTTYVNGFGYEQVMLQKNGMQKMFSVHRLVALAFIDNPDNLPQVNHIDENKLNNRADNLEFVTARQNLTHNNLQERQSKKKFKHVLQCAIDGTVIKEYESVIQAARETGIAKTAIANRCRGYISGPYGDFLWKYKDGIEKNSKRIVMYDLDGNFMREYNGIRSAARELGVGRSQISTCINGKSKTAHGYIWKEIIEQQKED